jgi:hypothetical protein
VLVANADVSVPTFHGALDDAMRILWKVTLFVLCTVGLNGQSTVTAPRKSADRNPTCSSGAICFAGEVHNGKQFRHTINSSLVFVVQPGWTVAIVPRQPRSDCDEFASVVNAGYRAHRPLDIEESYGWSAQDEMDLSPRNFYFVTNCADHRTEAERLGIVLWGNGHTQAENGAARKQLGTSPLGEGKLWITKYKITSAGSNSTDNTGQIEWMRFSVEIKLPKS